MVKIANNALETRKNYETTSVHYFESFPILQNAHSAGSVRASEKGREQRKKSAPNNKTTPFCKAICLSASERLTMVGQRAK